MCSIAKGTSQNEVPLRLSGSDRRGLPGYGHSSQKAALWRLLTRKRRRTVRQRKGEGIHLEEQPKPSVLAGKYLRLKE